MPFTACLTNTQQKQQKTHPTTGTITPAAGPLQNKRQQPTNQPGKNPDQPHWLSPDARVHYPHIKHPTHQPHPPAHSQQATKEAQNKQTPPPGETPQGRFAGLIPQGPTACQNQPPTHRTPRFHTHHHHPPRGTAAADSTEEARRARRRRSSMIPLVNTTNASHTDGGCAGRVLLRKEVIQPHLPVRLPCYDFVPIASPTFDGSPHKGWATGFGCCRLS